MGSHRIQVLSRVPVRENLPSVAIGYGRDGTINIGAVDGNAALAAPF